MVICLERGADCLHMVQLMPLHPKTPPSLVSFKSRLVLPVWYRLTQVVLEKRPLNGCNGSNDLQSCYNFDVTPTSWLSWIDTDVQSVNVRIHSAWRKATLHNGHSTDEDSFTACVPLLVVKSAFGLVRRCKSFSQESYIHVLSR